MPPKLEFAKKTTILKAVINCIFRDLQGREEMMTKVEEWTGPLDWTLKNRKNQCILHWPFNMTLRSHEVIQGFEWLLNVPGVSQMINLQDKDGNTPFHVFLNLVIRYGTNYAEFDIKVNIARKFISSGADIHLKNDDKWTCLDLLYYSIPTELRNAILAPSV